MIICLFDIDGTLLTSGGAGKAALEGALCEEFSVSMRAKVPYSGRTDRAIVRDLFRLHDVEETLTNVARMFTAYLQRLPGLLRAHRGKVLPGVAGLLQCLCERPDVVLGLLTGNMRAGAIHKLEHYGLNEHFSFGGFGDHHFDRSDVARDALDEVRRHVGPHINPEQVWVIGDTPLDVQCARAIGARVAAVATGYHSLQDLEAAAPDLLMTDFTDPSPLLECW